MSNIFEILPNLYISTDIPINYNGNIFPEEVKKYKDCIPPIEYGKLTDKAKETALLCPAACDFQKCEYKCFDNKCCFSKKTLMRKSYNISLIRSGCRDYQLTLNIEYEYCINNLIKILQDALYELNKNNVINELHILHKKMITD